MSETGFEMFADAKSVKRFGLWCRLFHGRYHADAKMSFLGEHEELKATQSGEWCGRCRHMILGELVKAKVAEATDEG